MPAPFDIRRALASDLPAVCAVDPVARDRGDRRRSIRDRVGAGEAWVAMGDGAASSTTWIRATRN